MAGWRRCEDHWWAGIAAHLPRPWPREAVYQDLRYWAAQPTRPGRPTLAERWGWGEKAARLVLADEAAWVDPLDKGQTRASQGPAKGQDLTRKPLESQDPGASEGPAKGQPRANARDPYRDQKTNKTKDQDPPLKIPPLAPPPEREPQPLGEQGSPVSDPLASAPGPSRAAPAVEEPPPPPTRKAPQADREAALYAAWRAYHPRAEGTPSKSQLRALRQLRAEAGDDAELLLDWVHLAPDRWACQLRGEEPWPDGERICRTDLASLSRSVEARLAQARAWRDRGRSAPPRAPPADPRRSGLDLAAEAQAMLRGRPAPIVIDAEILPSPTSRSLP